MPFPIKKKIKIIVILDIFILIAFLILSFLMIRLIKSNSKKFIEIQKSLLFSEQKRKEFQAYKNKFEEIKASLKEINNLFLDKNRALELFNFLEKSAIDSGNYYKIDVLTKEENEKKNFWQLQISLYGGFSNFMKFLNRIETAPYLLQIESIRIRKISLSDIEKYKKKFPLKENMIKSEFIIKIFLK